MLLKKGYLKKSKKMCECWLKNYLDALFKMIADKSTNK